MICKHTYLTLKCDSCTRVLGREYEYFEHQAGALMDHAREYGWEGDHAGHWFCPRCVPKEAIR